MAKHAPHRLQSAQAHFIRPTAVALAVAACFSGPVLANPANPTVVHGAATFATAGNILNITNGHNAIINWGSFSIGVNELTRFIQPSALSAVLNRVIGQDPSAILGALQSNGRVFLLNPNGIVFGAGAQINVAGLVASTLNLSNDDFLNNRMRFTDGAGAGSVVNQGSITGGNVYLVGKSVSNEGLITSPNGEVVLAAGNSVELVNPGTPNLRVEIVAPDNEARNLGTISAEAGRIGIYAGLITNSGTLNASSAVAEGGRILLKAKKDITLATTSVLDASGNGGGEIIAFADNNMYVDGVLNATAPVSGNGGFIETSGKNRVKIADSAVIDTTASQGIKGTWLIDPSDFVIAAGYGGDISGSNLSALLQSNDIVISTAAYGGLNYYYGSGAYGGGNGDILVNDAVSWDSSNSLTLTAQRHVVVNQAITNLGVGDISLNAGWDGITDPAIPNLTDSSAAIMLNSPISTGGNAYLHAGGNIIQGASAPIMASNLQAVSDNSSVSLNGSSNIVGTLAGSAVGMFAFKNSGNLNIGSVGGSNGITVNPGAGRNVTVNVEVAGGALMVSENIYANAGNGGMVQTAGGNATITLSASNGITVSDYAWVQAEGGDGLSYYGGSPVGGVASIQLTANNGAINIIDGGEVYANGGGGGQNNGLYAAGGAANVKFTAGNGIVVDGAAGGSEVRAYGGYGSPGGTATVELINNGASSAVQILNSADVVARGGDGSEGGAGGNALVMISSAGGITVNNDSSVEAIGGYSQYPYTGQGGAAAVTMVAGGSIQIEGGEGAAWGGSGATGGNAAVNLIAGGGITVSNNGGGGSSCGSECYYYGPNNNLLAYAGSGNTPGQSSTVLAAAGNVALIDGANIYANGVVGLGGANIMLDNAYASGNTGVSVSATGSLSLMNGSYLSSGGNAYINTGGNVTVDNSHIYGNPEVVMNVGGVINMNNMGTIEAGSPSTILLTFPMLTGGGFFVNGIEGVVYDSGTGFVVLGNPAELGVNLFVTYGGSTPLNIPTNTLIVAMGESTKPPDPEKDKDVFEDLKKEKEKEAPVCR